MFVNSGTRGNKIGLLCSLSVSPLPLLFFRWTYAASKGAVNILTKTMALDLAPWKIRYCYIVEARNPPEVACKSTSYTLLKQLLGWLVPSTQTKPVIGGGDVMSFFVLAILWSRSREY